MVHTRYDAASAGVYGSGVLCEEHNDVGLITLDACASAPGLHALRRADGLWVPLEEACERPDGALALVCMVGDTLGRLSNKHLEPCKVREDAIVSRARFWLREKDLNMNTPWN